MQAGQQRNCGAYQQGHKASHSPPSSANIKYDHCYIPAFTDMPSQHDALFYTITLPFTFQHATSWCCMRLTGITAHEMEKFQRGSFSHLRTILKFRGSSTKNLEGTVIGIN